jgi:hypothetical protein
VPKTDVPFFMLCYGVFIFDEYNENAAEILNAAILGDASRGLRQPSYERFNSFAISVNTLFQSPARG